jgi:hypothetical protein
MLAPMSRLCSRSAFGVAATLACLSLPALAHAQTGAGDKAAAESLFDRGLSLMRDGKFQEACQTLEQSQAIERGLGTMLYLAECYEKLGRTASAWALFREAASEARAAGQTARADTGAARAAALEPKLSKLTMRVDPKNLVAGFELLRDGHPVGRGLYGVAVPIDPGEHQLEARAPGRVPWSSVQRVGADGDSVSVDVPELLPDASAPVAPAEQLPQTGGAAVDLAAAPTPTGTSSVQRTVGLVAGGAGVVALGVGAFFGARAMSKNDDAKEHCKGSQCRDREGIELTDDAQSAATLANVFVIGGAALAATGVVLYLTAPTEEAPAAALSTDGRGVRLTVGGVF